MNIVYGGSFNPPTLAHQKIVETLFDKLKPENIIIVPTADNYTWKNIANFNHRLKMCEIAFPKAIICDIEGENSQYRGTLNTLNRLSQFYDDIYFCMGADNLVNIKRWINYEALLKTYKFIVFSRESFDCESYIKNELSSFKDRFISISFDYNISASMFRASHDENIISKEVSNYIKKNHLYEE